MNTSPVPKNRFGRPSKKIVILGCVGLLLFSCLLIILVGVFQFNNYPAYVELDIPLPIKNAETVRSTFTWGDTGDNYFIWRREMRAYEPDFHTWKSVIDYFDKSLVDQGWVYQDAEWFPCNAYMPETEFLPLGEDGYIFYRRPEAKMYHAEVTVCLAVWPITGTSGFNVVLQTINPSPLAVYRSVVD
jgi:hypothetical protein